MSALDWVIFAAYLAAIVFVGARAARGASTTAGFFVADRSMPWWAVGLSVMATQASAITFIGTTGLAYAEGMRFAQFYFGLPVAMAILAVTLVPLYHRAKVYTAYELLGRRFDEKTRLLTALLFLLSRGLALGVVIYAPSVVLSLLLGWSTTTTVLCMTGLAVLYTVLGGIRAVIWTDVIQMVVIFAGLGLCLLTMLRMLPEGTSLGDALTLARVTDRLTVLDFSFDPQDRYTVWSGLLGGTFLFLAYFGCDQSQVQRFLSGRSLRDNRMALLFNAVFKIPVQLFVLFLGVLLFAVFHFEQPPLLFDGAAVEQVSGASGDDGQRLAQVEQDFAQALDQRRARAEALIVAERAGGDDALRTRAEAAYVAADERVDDVRAAGGAIAARALGEPVGGYDDRNHVFPYFVIHHLPLGIVGLLIAVIFAAAMSSIDSELNSLSTTTTVDVYRRVRPDATDAQLVRFSRGATLLWGGAAAAFAVYARTLGSVIEAVNQIGSFFYGSLLGVFVLALYVPRANGTGAFLGLLAGMGAVAAATTSGVAWLWLNPIGCVTVVVTGAALSRLTTEREST